MSKRLPYVFALTLTFSAASIALAADQQAGKRKADPQRAGNYQRVYG